jgi:flagellar hook-basal body complex protein FliE
LLKNAVESVNAMQHEAGRLEDAVANGENVNIHQAVIAGEKAGLSFQLLMQVRNKMIDAYQEVMRMQV